MVLRKKVLERLDLPLWGSFTHRASYRRSGQTLGDSTRVLAQWSVARGWRMWVPTTKCATRSVWPIMVRIRSFILSVATLKSWLNAPSRLRMTLEHCQWLRLLFWRKLGWGMWLSRTQMMIMLWQRMCSKLVKWLPMGYKLMTRVLPPRTPCRNHRFKEWWGIGRSNWFAFTGTTLWLRIQSWSGKENHGLRSVLWLSLQFFVCASPKTTSRLLSSQRRMRTYLVIH